MSHCAVKTAVLLAAGRGTRMKHLTADRPKPLVPVAGRPILEWILTRMRDAGIRRFVIVTGYLGHMVREYFGDGSSLGIELHYAEQVEQTGTATALLLCKPQLADEPFLMSWGDILIEPRNYHNLLSTYRETPCDVLLSVNHVDDPYKGAAVYFDEDGVVSQVIEKPPQGTSTTNYNNAGVFILTPKALQYAEQLEPSPRGEYELPEAIRTMIDDGCPVRAMTLEGYWSDVGTPEDVDAMSALLREKTS